MSQLLYSFCVNRQEKGGEDSMKSSSLRRAEHVSTQTKGTGRKVASDDGNDDLDFECLVVL